MKVEHVTRDYLIRQIAKSFRSAGEIRATYLGIIGEHLRAGCLVLGTSESEAGNGLASSIQLYKQTYRRLLPLFPNYLDSADEIRGELNHLQDLGDLARLDGHNVRIAPARRLEIDSERCLILGGGPIQVLPLALQKQLTVSGRSRIMTSAMANDLQQAFPVQRLEDWLNLEDDNMLKWATDFVAAKLKAKCDNFVPDGLRIWNGQFWRTLEEFDGPSGACVCRRGVLHYGNPTHEYGLVKLKRISNKAQIDTYTPIERDVARKLQGALHQIGTKAEKFVMKNVRPGILELTLRHPIAQHHSKLLLLGWMSQDSYELEPGVQKIEFSEILLPLLRKGFGLIGYELVSR